MPGNEKQVKVKIATEEELSGVEALELKIKKLNAQKIQLGIDIASQKLDETQSKIDKLKQEKANLEVGVDDSKIKEIDLEIAQLEQESVNLQIEVETGKLKQTEAEIEDLDGTTIDVNVDNISAMQSIEQIGQGFDRLKSGASEVGQQMGVILDSAGAQEMNKTFLEMNLGAQGASDAVKKINNIVADMPGDDTALQGLLSQAMVKNAGMTEESLRGIATSATDYFSAMSFYGKSATEAQQDMTNYILSGNTAELERSPILQGHIDKLKEANTVEERSKLLQEALNEEGWGGISTQETYNNKLETFNGMLERGRYNLGGMLQEGAKWGMDFVLQLDEASGGIVGMGIRWRSSGFCGYISCACNPCKLW